MKAQKKILAALGGAVAASLSMISIAHADQNPFDMKALSHGYMVADAGDQAADGKMKDGKCSTGKCSTSKKKMKDKEAAADTKAKEGNCSADKKMKDGNCSSDMKH